MIRALYKLMLVMVGSAIASTVLSEPTADQKGREVGLIWIQGNRIHGDAYVPLITKLADSAAEESYKLWVAFPSFTNDVPRSQDMEKQIQKAMSDIKQAGFKGDKFFIAAHSSGTIPTLEYTKAHPESFIAQILMGGSIPRAYRSHNNFTGTTQILTQVQTLVLNGERDGLERITRAAESYYHQVISIYKDQQGGYPVQVLKGLNHASFIDSKYTTDRINKYDIKSEVPKDKGFDLIVERIMAFIAHKEGDGANSGKFEKFIAETDEFFMPFIQAMFLEGSYNLKSPCENTDTIANPFYPKRCLSGSPWVSQIQSHVTHGVKINTFDNFHTLRSSMKQGIFPVINNTCHNPDVDDKCVLSGMTVSENVYHRYRDNDLSIFPNAASEMMAMFNSRQSVQVHAGNHHWSTDLDAGDHRICQALNHRAIEWALDNVDNETLAIYQEHGKKLVAGNDIIANSQSGWLHDKLRFTDNSEDTETSVQSSAFQVAMGTGDDLKQGYQFCKLLSPYRALEWIYVDSLIDYSQSASKVNHWMRIKNMVTNKDLVPDLSSTIAKLLQF